MGASADPWTNTRDVCDHIEAQAEPLRLAERLGATNSGPFLLVGLPRVRLRDQTGQVLDDRPGPITRTS